MPHHVWQFSTNLTQASKSMLRHYPNLPHFFHVYFIEKGLQQNFIAFLIQMTMVVE